MQEQRTSIGEQLGALLGDKKPQSIVSKTVVTKTLSKPAPRKSPDPRSILTASSTDLGVIIKRINDKSYVTSEAQLYHMIATVLTTEGTDSLWFARTPARSPRGELWVLHNPRALQVLVDPLAVCRSAMQAFNKEGKVELHCYGSQKDYYSPSQTQQTSRIKPAVTTNASAEVAEVSKEETDQD